MVAEMYTPYKVFIATPSDLSEERNSLHRIAEEVNKNIAHHLGYHIEIVGWEEMSPGMGRPQSLINNKLKQCDLVIVSFWKKWGIPSGEYSSGTEEEYYTAKKLYDDYGRPEISILFKEQDEDRNIAIQIEQFKSKIENSREALYKKFTSLDEWNRIIRNMLCERIFQKKNEAGSKNLFLLFKKKILYYTSYTNFQTCIECNQPVEPMIYFTIQDENSFKNWCSLKRGEKKHFIFELLEENFWLILGAKPYKAKLRYKRINGQYILLGAITKQYSDSEKESFIFISGDYNMLCEKSEYETPFEGIVHR